MGIDPDVEFGNDCLACFNADETPKVIYAAFMDIEWCPWVPLVNRFPPPNKKRCLTQTGDPCIWQYADANITVTYWSDLVLGPFHISRLKVNLWIPPGTAFIGNSAMCGNYFVSTLGVGNCAFPDFCCHAGHAQLTWNLAS